MQRRYKVEVYRPHLRESRRWLNCGYFNGLISASNYSEHLVSEPSQWSEAHVIDRFTGKVVTYSWSD